MTSALYALSATATVLAWLLALRRVEHRPIAYLLTLGLASDLAQRALRAFALDAAGARFGDATWTGSARVWAHVYDAVFISWPAGVVAASLVAFLHRKPWPVVFAYTGVVAAMVIVHPMARDGTLARAYASIQLVAVLASLGCAVTWYRHKSKVPTSTAQASLMLILGIEVASLLAVWRVGVFSDWHVYQVGYLLLFSILTLMQGGFLWQSRSSS